MVEKPKARTRKIQASPSVAGCLTCFKFRILKPPRLHHFKNVNQRYSKNDSSIFLFPLFHRCCASRTLVRL
jgi:hypothetical protein